MGIEENVVKWLLPVALRKAGVALTGYITGWAIAYVTGEQMAHILQVLQTFGVTVTVAIDKTVFEPRMAGLGVVGFTLAHDYLKLRFPSIKWL